MINVLFCILLLVAGFFSLLTICALIDLLKWLLKQLRWFYGLLIDILCRIILQSTEKTIAIFSFSSIVLRKYRDLIYWVSMIAIFSIRITIALLLFSFLILTFFTDLLTMQTSFKQWVNLFTDNFKRMVLASIFASNKTDNAPKNKIQTELY